MSLTKWEELILLVLLEAFHTKPHIHSTDTHGYSEAIFAIAYLLGFSYAPRIKNLKRQTLYTF